MKKNLSLIELYQKTIIENNYKVFSKKKNFFLFIKINIKSTSFFL